MSKQTRPHSPAGTRLAGPDRDGTYTIVIPSESRSGKEHTLTVRYDGTLLGCTCEGYAAFLADRAASGTAESRPPRRPCWHAVAAADLLAHHLDRPPADPGGAALGAAQAEVDDEADAWEAELRRVRHDEGLRALYGG